MEYNIAIAYKYNEEKVYGTNQSTVNYTGLVKCNDDSNLIGTLVKSLSNENFEMIEFLIIFPKTLSKQSKL